MQRTHNAAGDVTEEAGTSYRYDGEGRLRIVVRGNERETFLYDSAGNRILATRTVNGATTQVRRWMGDTEFAVSNATTTSDVTLRLGGPVARLHDGQLQYIHQNATGNLMLAMDAIGTPMAGFSYGAFGEVLESQQNAGLFKRRFQDRQRDEMSGWYDYGQRLYDPLTHLWNRADPVYTVLPDAAACQPRRASLYAFSGNNPLRYLDPDGRDWLTGGAAGFFRWAAAEGAQHVVNAVGPGVYDFQVGIMNSNGVAVGGSGSPQAPASSGAPASNAAPPPAEQVYYAPEEKEPPPPTVAPPSAEPFTPTYPTGEKPHGDASGGGSSVPWGKIGVGLIGATLTVGSTVAGGVEGAANSLFGAGIAGQVLLLTAGSAGSVWHLDRFARGFAIEDILGSNLPRNFPTIDRWKDGVATSIKSIDLNAKSYQDIPTLRRTLNGYIDKVAGFNGRQWGGATVRASEITGRSLEIAIPMGSGSVEQMAALQSAVQYGQGVGVNVIVLPVW